MVIRKKVSSAAAAIGDHNNTTGVDNTAKDTSTWVTRNEASALLSISEQTLANYERRGKLHPQYAYRRDRHKIDRRVVVYDPRELTTLRPYRPYTHNAVAPRDPGEVGARAFELFREGRTEEEVVIELRLDPDAVHALHDRRLDMGGSDLVISPVAKTALEKVLGPFADVTELVEKVVKRLESPPKVKERLDGERAPVIDHAFETTQLVSAAPRASVPPRAGGSVAEVPDTGASLADGEAAGAAVGPAVELPGAGASTHTASAPDTSTTRASANDEGA